MPLFIVVKIFIINPYFFTNCNLIEENFELKSEMQFFSTTLSSWLAWMTFLLWQYRLSPLFLSVLFPTLKFGLVNILNRRFETSDITNTIIIRHT